MINSRYWRSSCLLFKKTWINVYGLNIKKPNLQSCHSHGLLSRITKNDYKVIVNTNLKYLSNVSNKSDYNIDTCESQAPENGKLFFEHENEFCHGVMERLPQYKQHIYINDRSVLQLQHLMIRETEFNEIVSKSDWGDNTAEDIIMNFTKISLYNAKHLKLPISNNMFSSICNGLIKVTKELSDEQLLSCLKTLILWPLCDSVKADNFLTLWKALDDKCYSRLNDRVWDINTILYVMDLWFALRLSRLSYFVFTGLKLISRKAKRLESHQLVHTLFIMNTVRKLHPAISIYEYEFQLEKELPNLTLEEIGVAVSGFFKTQKKIVSEKFVSEIIQRLIKECNSAQPITITQILKIIRFSASLNHVNDLNLLITNLIPRMNTFNLQVCVHSLLTLTPMVILNERAIDKLVERFLQEPSNTRLKDLEKIVSILLLYNYIPPSAPHVLDTIVSELNKPTRAEEIDRYRSMFAQLLCDLSMLRVYPQPFIAKVLSEDWILETYGKPPYKIPRSLVCLDYNVEIENPNANVPRISDKAREYVARKFAYYIPGQIKKKLTFFEQQFLDVVNATEAILTSKENYLISYILPHLGKADILYCLNDDNKPVPIPEEMRNKREFSGIIRPTQPGKWFSIVILSRTMCPFNCQSLVGEAAAKMRQLKLVGYTPVVVPWYQWNTRTKESFTKYMEEQIFKKT